MATGTARRVKPGYHAAMPEPRIVASLLALTALVVVGKLSTLDTPYYWDETSWVSAAHWLSSTSLARALPGAAPPATFFGHPPGLHLALAALWTLTGPSIPIAHGLALVFALAGIVFTYLLGRTLYDNATGFLAALLLFLSPIYFAQSGMFLGDVPVAALGTMSTYFALRERYRLYLLSATAMVLIKETGMAVVVAIAVYMFLTAGSNGTTAARRLLRYGAPLLASALFVAWQKLATGHFFWIFDFDVRLIEFGRALAWPKLVRITQWLFVHQGRYVLTISIILTLLLSQRCRRQREWWFLGLVVLLSGYTFWFLYFLPRYLLPVLPYFYLAGVRSLMTLVPGARARVGAALLLLGLAAWSLVTQPFEGNAEFNPRYREVVELHVAACDFISSELPGRRVATAWPHSLQLTQPYLGYVKRPVPVIPLLAADPAADDVILLSMPGTHHQPGQLQAQADRHGWRLIRRFQGEQSLVAVFARG
jgi:hypothetical protein